MITPSPLDRYNDRGFFWDNLWISKKTEESNVPPVFGKLFPIGSG